MLERSGTRADVHFWRVPAEGVGRAPNPPPLFRYIERIEIGVIPVNDELAKLYTEVLSAKGNIRLSCLQVIQLADLCISKNVVVDTVEAFEITHDSELPRTDLSMYGPNESSLGQDWKTRVRVSCDEARTIATQALRSNTAVVFQVWLDEEH
ncbi:hypothetical protein GCM10008942_10680 [Rhizomicrobium electricum]|uniref:Uncharacterized protein n=1 Tax=Rhizomicrobium electricum TaxID=480070 RepID=A0ABN1EDC2_9PROT